MAGTAESMVTLTGTEQEGANVDLPAPSWHHLQQSGQPNRTAGDLRVPSVPR